MSTVHIPIYVTPCDDWPIEEQSEWLRKINEARHKEPSVCNKCLNTGYMFTEEGKILFDLISAKLEAAKTGE